jgi:N-acetylmuramic acid 6-phosphate etherase
MWRYLRHLAATYPALVRLELIGESTGGRPIFAVRVGAGGDDAADAAGGAESSALPGRLRVLLFAQQHGNEPAGKEACLILIRDLAAGPLRPLLSKLVVWVVPQVNPDGAVSGARLTACGSDLNRGHLLLRTRELHALYGLFHRVLPHITVDLHEHNVETKARRADGLLARYDLMAEGPTNPNVGPALRDLSQRALAEVAERLAAGGRLVYVGAGTSGGLAKLDAAECPATFGTPPELVIALGSTVCRDAEDDVERGDADVRAAGVGPADVVVGISASGSTPYTVAALEAARAAGALCVAVVCARDSALERIATHAIVADVGPEIVSGSTRLKAGTAQKLILNALSTLTMIRLGKTYDGLMVGVVPENAKLRERARRNVVLASGASEQVVDDALAAAEGDARVALVTLLAGIDATAARERLDRAHGSVRGALA